MNYFLYSCQKSLLVVNILIGNTFFLGRNVLDPYKIHFISNTYLTSI